MAHFVDEAILQVRSGKGGDGCMSFRREKYVPRGGPDGGDGGRGGHVILVADPAITTLLDLGGRTHYFAEDGRPGQGKNKWGRTGADLEIRVPVGTVVRDRATNETLIDLDRPGLRFTVARGGRGGRGNRAFATATHQAPREWERGDAGEERELSLELKLMADVGLLGFPNAGKSTLLSRISRARPRIADYPFTTLTPQLGIVEIDADRRIVVADIPGILEGAHEGVGLGIEFLRHIERTRVLIHLVDPHDRTLDELVHDHQVIRKELGSYSPDLVRRPSVTVLSKLDLIPETEWDSLQKRLQSRLEAPVLGISAITGRGLSELLEVVWRLLPRADRNGAG